MHVILLCISASIKVDVRTCDHRHRGYWAIPYASCSSLKETLTTVSFANLYLRDSRIDTLLGGAPSDTTTESGSVRRNEWFAAFRSCQTVKPYTAVLIGVGGVIVGTTMISTMVTIVLLAAPTNSLTSLSQRRTALLSQKRAFTSLPLHAEEKDGCCVRRAFYTFCRLAPPADAPIGSLIRQGPVPFIVRLVDPDKYERSVQAYMAKEGCSRREAQGNMDA